MQRNLSLLAIICLLFILGLACSNQDENPEIQIPKPEKLDSLLNYYVDEGFYPFVYARLEDLDGNVIYEHGTVNEELLPNTTVDGDTWIRIWSMSKIVTISVALDLVEDGIINLDDPVSKYIPEFADLQVAVSSEGKGITEYDYANRDQACPIELVPNDSVMTVLHLINHEAGFYYAVTGYSCLDELVAEQNLPKAENSDDLINRMATLPLIQHSGDDYFYGTNTTVLGLVAEKATGKSLSQLVQERVTDPMNISGLQYGLPENQTLLPTFTGRDSVLREAQRGELDIFGPDVPDYDMDHQLYLGGEGMVATADGYADFIRMLLKRGQLNGHRFLESETVEDLYAPHTLVDSPYGHNGYNLWVSGDTMRVMNQGEAGLWIGGGYENTYFWADPKRNFVGIVMSQNNEVWAPGYEMNDKFRAELYQQFWAVEDSVQQ